MTPPFEVSEFFTIFDRAFYLFFREPASNLDFGGLARFLLIVVVVDFIAADKILSSPEPMIILLLGVGLVEMCLVGRRRSRKA